MTDEELQRLQDDAWVGEQLEAGRAFFDEYSETFEELAK